MVTDGRLVAWFYTNRDGVVCRAPTHEVGAQGLYHKLAGAQGMRPGANNPNGYCAVAHFKNGVSRLLKADQLEELVGTYVVACCICMQLSVVGSGVCMQKAGLVDRHGAS